MIEVTPQEFDFVRASIKSAYPTFNVMPDQYSIRMWYRMLGDLDYKQSNGRSAAVEDQVVYEWAEDYYHKYEKPKPVKKEKGKKPVITKKPVTPTKTTEKITDNEKKSQETKDKPQISEKPVKKDAASKQRKTEKTSTKSSELSGQMSLFDLL